MRKCLTKFSRIFERGAKQKKRKKEESFAVPTRICRADCSLHHPGTCLASQAFIFWISAVSTRTVRAACPVHPPFLYFPRPRRFAAVWWGLLRGRVLRPEDPCQKRFSWCFYRIPEVQKRVNLVDLVKNFRTSYSEFTCKIRLRYSRERASQSLPKISQKLE